MRRSGGRGWSMISINRIDGEERVEIEDGRWRVEDGGGTVGTGGYI